VRYLSLCSGIEAATVAWHPMGWEPAAFAEIESFPAAVLRHHYPNTPNLGDMTQWRTWNVGPIDLLVGGTPCQSFSVAGLRKGLSDPRGGLMLTFLEIAQSLRPRWVVWENVPGVLSSGGGRDFGAFLGALGELGYGWAYRVLDAQWCRVDGYERAVPQRRRRVFVVGCLGDQARAAQVLFERQSVERNPAARGKARQGAAADAEGGAESGGCYWDGSDCAATLTKQNAGGGQRMPDKANFGAVLQPARAWPAEVCSTLNASFGEKQRLEDQHALGGAPCFVPAVAGALDCDIPKQRVQNMAAGHWLAVPIQDGREIAKAQNGLGVGSEGDPAYTLDQTGAQAVAIQGNLIGRDVGGPQGVGASTDGAMYTLTKADVHGVAVPFRKSHRASSATDDESWVRAETANTLNSFDTGERDTHAVTAIAFTQNQREEVRELGGVTGALSGQGTHQTTYIAATIDMQACKGNANIGDGSVSPTLCKPSGSDVHAVAIGLYNQAIDGDCAATLTEACGGTNTSGPKVMQVAYTLDGGHGATEDGTGRGVPLTVAFHPTQDPISSTDGTTHAMGCGSKQGTATVGVAYPINGMWLNKELRDKQMTGIGDESDPMYTVRADGTQHAISFKPGASAQVRSIGAQDGVACTVEAGGGGNNRQAVAVAPSLTSFTDAGQGQRIRDTADESETLRATKRGPFSDYYATQMVVRRLTPVECERLQGFPDDYTNIPWRGKTESPDGPRYKALGNSMAVNCMRWIGRRIDAVEKGTDLPD
jgi:site-specific DNA-cytosine methylase